MSIPVVFVGEHGRSKAHSSMTTGQRLNRRHTFLRTLNFQQKFRPPKVDPEAIPAGIFLAG
jgi:hypothetical protein